MSPSVADALTKVSTRSRPLTIRGGMAALFGADAAIPVRLAGGGEAESLHRRLLTGLQGLIDLVEPEYAGEGFRPHVTAQRTSGLASGESRTLHSISLVAMDGRSGEVTAVYPLAGL
jgi:2'-5' RNA ligase